MEVPESPVTLQKEGIGIDLGIKELAICSDGNTYKNINKTKTVKKLEKKKRRLQRSISRQYEKNKKGESYWKTRNIIKREKILLKLNKRLSNLRQNYTHQITSEIVKREPSFLCVEDLNVRGMMKINIYPKPLGNKISMNLEDRFSIKLIRRRFLPFLQGDGFHLQRLVAVVEERKKFEIKRPCFQM